MKNVTMTLTILVFSIFILGNLSFGQVTFSEQMIVFESDVSRPYSVCASDIDGDGDMDVLSASYGDNKISWYENTDGMGTFGTQQVIKDSVDGAHSVYAADLDCDGDMDVLSASIGYRDNKGNYHNFKVAWYENTDGAGNFGTQQVITDSLEGASYVYAADLDGDGDMDVLSASSVRYSPDNKIVWYENTDGQGTFETEHVISTSEYHTPSLYAVDLDGDSDMDVLSASSVQYSPDNKIAWYENTDGLGTFGIEQIISTSADGACSVYAADLDGDGDRDVVSASVDDHKIAWYENTDGAGHFGDQQIITNTARGARDVYASDLDSDGDMDVLSAAYLDNRVAWYENTDGQGTFGAKQVITDAADGVLSVCSADIDGDGDIDVLSASIGHQAFFGDFCNDEVVWYANTDGQGTFGDKQVITDAADGVCSAYVSDLDGDGDLDVLSASIHDNKIAWYENTDGLGTFGRQQIISDSVREARTVCASDLDGDGDMDVLAGSYYDDYIAWFENTDGLGTFGDRQIISNLTHGATCVTTSDLDGDGDMDVLSASWGDRKIAWYENLDGAGTFGDQQGITGSAVGAQCVAAFDLDGDGDMDVLSASRDDDTIAWYKNYDGLGSFGARQIITTDADGAWSVTASDLNSDGELDALSASYKDGKIAWYKNIGGFDLFGSQKVITDSAGSARSVFAADLDNDNDMDVLSPFFTNKGVQTIVWHENTNGHGVFGDEQTIGDLRWPRSIYASDIDGDGDLDVLAASEYDDKIVWYKNLFIEMGVEEEETVIPSDFQLGQNYPNPFNCETVIHFDIQKQGHAVLLVYDIKGRRVAVAAEGVYPPGRYTVTFDGTGLPSGIYLYRLEAGDFMDVKKMVLME